MYKIIRLNWRQLINHEFWEGRLKNLAPLKSIHVDEDDNDHLITDSKHHLSLSRLSSDRPRTAGAINSIILDQQKAPEVNVSFSISSRLPASPQATIQTRNPIQYKESDEQKSSNSSVSTITISQKGFETQRALEDNKDENIFEPQRDQSFNEYRRMFFLPSELTVSQIIDNPKVISKTYKF